MKEAALLLAALFVVPSVFAEVIYFRNDDVAVMSPEFTQLTELFIKESVPISHAVIPYKLTSETADYLLNEKKAHFELIDINQHGYKHINYCKGEFNTCRSYYRQYIDIRNGRRIMANAFGDCFSSVFTMPYNKYDNNTLRALQANYFIKYSASMKNYYTGKLPGYKLYDYGICVDVLDSNNNIKPLKSLISNYNYCKDRSNGRVGIMLHHEQINTTELGVLQEFIQYLKNDSSNQFKRISKL